MPCHAEPYHSMPRITLLSRTVCTHTSVYGDHATGLGGTSDAVKATIETFVCRVAELHACLLSATPIYYYHDDYYYYYYYYYYFHLLLLLLSI